MAANDIPDGPVHDFFELSYASYLVLPRSVLQSMPLAWQGRLVKLVKELDEKIDWRREGIEVSHRGPNGIYLHDDLRDYARGRRRIAWR